MDDKNPLRAYVAQLPLDTLVYIHQDTQELQRNGSIGDCTLRRVTEEFLAQEQGTGSSIFVIWMDRVSHEVYRRLAVSGSPLLSNYRRPDLLAAAGDVIFEWYRMLEQEELEPTVSAQDAIDRLAAAVGVGQ